MAKASEKIPAFFKPILWSYQFSRIDPYEDKEIIVVNTINYGDLEHWRWISKFYGKGAVRALLKKIPASSFRPKARRLAALLFDIKRFNYASRGSRRKK